MFFIMQSTGLILLVKLNCLVFPIKKLYQPRGMFSFNKVRFFFSVYFQIDIVMILSLFEYLITFIQCSAHITSPLCLCNVNEIFYLPYLWGEALVKNGMIAALGYRKLWRASCAVDLNVYFFSDIIPCFRTLQIFSLVFIWKSNRNPNLYIF